MIKYIFFEPISGLPQMVAVPQIQDMYITGEIYNGLIAVSIETDIDDLVIYQTYHWTGTELGTHEPNNDQFAVWDNATFSYVRPDNYLDLIKEENISQVKLISGNKILVSYPIYRQINLAREPSTEAAITMHGFIDNIRNLSNISEDEILQATNVDAVQTALDDFILTMSLI